MGRIRILSAEVAGRIAAGEVIERPASVVKELVENSLDAGADRIRIFIEQGGHKLIQVIDNGCGMDREDAMMCLQAHATSKISTESDVGQIHTLGFRGEALPSIASVSRFELRTRTRESDTGTEILVNNGIISDVRDCGCAPGTSISAAYLFGNLPARRKFLKGPVTENDRITETVMLLALSRPGVSFELTLNGKCVFRVPGAGDIASRVGLLLGKDAFDAMLPVDYAEDGIHIYGFVSKPGFTRSSHKEQRVIINGRAATADAVYYAIRDSYSSLVTSGRHPCVVLYIDLDPERVDVNVHPAKREVRFRDSMRVSAIIAAALRNALRGLNVAPIFSEGVVHAPQPAAQEEEVRFQEEAPNPPQNQAQAPLPPPSSPASPQPALQRAPLEAIPPAPLPPPFAASSAGTVPAAPSFEPIQSPLPFRRQEAAPSPHSSSAPAAADAAPSPAETPSGRPALSFKLLGMLGQNHLLAESSGGLIVVNIRAAMQRIVFERMLANLDSGKPAQQPLLLPITVNLAPDEARIMSRELAHFNALGYSVDPFGAGTFLVTAVPAGISDNDIVNMIRDVITDLHRETVTTRNSAIHLAQAAARHAVRPLRSAPTPQEQQALIHDLTHCRMPYTDPAGLPTMVHITYSELNKRFNP